MTSRRAIRSVLHNFLGTYVSRYSDFNGYWLFGFLVKNIRQVEIDLMHTSEKSDDRMPLAVARRLATVKFAEQIQKARIPWSCIREAHLDITKSPDLTPVAVNGRICHGYKMTLVARVVTDLGRAYKTEMSIVVAPHNPLVELGSARASVSSKTTHRPGLFPFFFRRSGGRCD
jgi:hypothetical protein